MLERKDPQESDQNGNSLEAYAREFDMKNFLGFDHRGYGVFYEGDQVRRVVLDIRGEIHDIDLVGSYGKNAYEHVKIAAEKHGEWWLVTI